MIYCIRNIKKRGYFLFVPLLSFSLLVTITDILFAKNSSSSLNQETNILLDRADKLRTSGEFIKSIDCFDKALLSVNKFGDVQKELEICLKLANLYWNIGKLQESLNYYHKSYSIAKKMNLAYIAENIQNAFKIHLLYKEALTSRSAGKNEKSIELLNEAINIAQDLGNKEFELKCLRQLSLSFWQLNNLKEFFALNTRAAKIAQELSHKIEIAKCLNNIGLSYWKLDNYAEALSCFEKAVKLFNEEHYLENITDCYNNIGIIYNELGNYEKAIEYFNASLEIDKNNNTTSFIAADLNNLGNTYRKKALLSSNESDLIKALSYFDKCLDAANKINEELIIIHALNNMGTVYSDLHHFLKALECFQSAQEKATLIQDHELLGVIFNNLGIIYANQGDYEKSIEYYQKAINLAIENGGGQFLWEAYLEIANAYKKQRKLSQALENYKNSIAVIEDIRSRIDLEELRASYLGTDKRIDAYQNIIDLLANLHQSAPGKGYDSEAFAFLEKGKARAFLDSLELSSIDLSQGVNIKLLNQEKDLMNSISQLYKKLLIPELAPDQKTEIQNSLKSYEEKLESLKREIRITSPEYAKVKYPEIITLKETQKTLLDNKTLCLAYSVGKSSSYAFAITRASVKIFPIPSRAELQKQITEYLRLITDRENSDFRLGLKLYAKLVLPGIAQKVEKILVVPDDILHFFPFETLLTEENKQNWLVKKYQIAYAPSLSALREIIRHKGKNGSAYHKDILAIGDPYLGQYEKGNPDSGGKDILQDFYSNSTFKFSRLKYSGLEIEKIASFFNTKKTDILNGKRASEDDLKKRRLSDYKIIHFATHSLIDDKKPARSSILLTLNPEAEEDGFLQMREIFNLKLNAKLVVLSACQTGLGQYIRGEGIEGLSRAFFYAGASSVLMSLWAVNDQASYQLMERFYRRLRSSDSPMTALQKAKRDLINSDLLSHPYYWAGFIIKGDVARGIFPRPFSKWIMAIMISGGFAIFLYFTLKRTNHKKEKLFYKPRTELSYRVNQD